jgi:hypothetical protein
LHNSKTTFLDDLDMQQQRVLKCFYASLGKPYGMLKNSDMQEDVFDEDVGISNKDLDSTISDNSNRKPTNYDVWIIG